MSFEINKRREQLDATEYELSKLQTKKLFLQDILQDKLKFKEEAVKQNWTWLTVSQMAVEQTELEIAVLEAQIQKLVNEIKFYRLFLQELLEKRQPQ